MKREKSQSLSAKRQKEDDQTIDQRSYSGSGVPKKEADFKDEKIGQISSRNRGRVNDVGIESEFIQKEGGSSDDDDEDDDEEENIINQDQIFGFNFHPDKNPDLNDSDSIEEDSN